MDIWGFINITEQVASVISNILKETPLKKVARTEMAQRGLSVAGHSVKLSKDHHAAIEEVRYVSHASQA